MAAIRNSAFALEAWIVCGETTLTMVFQFAVPSSFSRSASLRLGAWKKRKPAHKTILNNHQQNQELTQLRDWLLPMLMNGQVTVGTNED